MLVAEELLEPAEPALRQASKVESGQDLGSESLSLLKAMAWGSILSVGVQQA